MLFAASGFSAVYPINADSLWSNPTHWNTGSLPVSSDEVIVNGGKTLTADTNATINILRLPNASNHAATFTMEDNITLQVTSAAYLGWTSYTNTISVMNHSAGTLNAPALLNIGGSNGSTSTYNQSGSSAVNAATLYILARSEATTTYNLSGGVLTGTTLDIGKASDSLTTGTTTFNQTGGTVSSETVQIAGRSEVNYIMSGGQMNVTDLIIGSGITPAFTEFIIGTDALGITVADDLTVGPRGEVTFNVAADGSCTTIEVADLFDVTSGSAKILVDAALYTGGPTNIELITFGNMGTMEFARQAIMNIPAGLTGSLVYTANNLSLDIVPDISTASVSNLTRMAGNIVSMDISAADPEISTVQTTTDLAAGTWESAPYSTNSGGPFATGALTGNEMTVYVQATNGTSFFKVGNN
jgi:hypothetical protein